MSDKINIDELLKQELSNMEVDAPSDVWQHIDSNLSNAAAVPNTPAQTLTNAAGGKAVFFGFKAIILSVSAIVVGALLVNQFVFNQDKPTPVNANEIIGSQDSRIDEPSEATLNTGLKIAEAEKEQSSPQTKRQFSSIKPVSKPSKLTDKEGAKVNDVTESRHERGETQQPSPKTSPIQKTSLADNKQVPVESPTEEVEKEDANKNPKPANQSEEESDAQPSIPNVFTPNGDGVNDQFIIGIEHEVVYDLKITSLKGEVLFESTDKNKYWDGKHPRTGEYCESGVYILVFRYQVAGMKEARVVNSKVIIKQ